MQRFEYTVRAEDVNKTEREDHRRRVIQALEKIAAGVAEAEKRHRAEITTMEQQRDKELSDLGRAAARNNLTERQQEARLEEIRSKYRTKIVDKEEHFSREMETRKTSEPDPDVFAPPETAQQYTVDVSHADITPVCWVDVYYKDSDAEGKPCLTHISGYDYTLQVLDGGIHLALRNRNLKFEHGTDDDDIYCEHWERLAVRDPTGLTLVVWYQSTDEQGRH